MTRESLDAEELGIIIKKALHEWMGDERDRRALVKAAIEEWLEQKYAVVGRWTLRGITAAALAALGYWMLTNHGWPK